MEKDAINLVQIDGGIAQYGVDKLLGETEAFRMYRCISAKFPGRELILKIVKEAALNPVLDREATLLISMRKEAFRIDKEYMEQTGARDPLNYQYFFPEVVDSFVSESQGGRMALILGFDISDKLELLVPIGRITRIDNLRVDPKTSAWMMGKGLKLLGFLSDFGVTNPNWSDENYLIQQEHHCVAVFDWSEATYLNPGKKESRDATRISIAALARLVITALGGDTRTGEIPDDSQLTDPGYAEMLKRFADRERDDAIKAHKAFYQLITDMWGRSYHPFSSYKLKPKETVA